MLLLVGIPFVSCNQIRERPQEETKIEVRSTFQAAQKGQHKKISTGWLKTLNHSQLSAIVHQALSSNPDLKVAASRLESVKQNAIIGRSNRLPQLNGSGRASLSRSNGSSSDSYALTLSSSWEPDLWGRLQDLESASYADYDAAIGDFRAARLSLAINTAQAWCNLVTAEKQLTLATQTLESFKKNFNIIERGYKAGTLRALDVNFGRNNVASAERRLRSRQLARNNAARSLNVLLGSYPDARFVSSTVLPQIPSNIQVGLPSSLLERRPDLIARRARLYASAKRADAARKNLLPNIRLTSSTGTSSSELRKLLDPSELASSIASSFTQSLYSGGELTSRARQSLANNQVQIDLYARDALNALR